MHSLHHRFFKDTEICSNIPKACIHYTIGFLKTLKSVQKKSACNSNYLHKLHVQPFPIYKMPLYSRKQKLQCFHSGLFLFGFDSIICNPFSMVWAILFPFAGVEDIVAAPCSATCGVLGVNPNTLPPPSVLVLAVRSIKTGGPF